MATELHHQIAEMTPVFPSSAQPSVRKWCFVTASYVGYSHQ
jgi:hypothetical protein